MREQCVPGPLLSFVGPGNEARASSVLEISFGLSEASFVCQPKSQELTTRVCSSKRLVEVSQKFLSPSTLYREVPTTGGLLDAFRLLVLG